MRKISLLLVLAVDGLAQVSAPPGLGPTRIMSGSGTLRSGMTIQFAAYAIPGGKWGGAFGGAGIKVGAETIHRSVIHSPNGAYFGYDLAFRGDATNGYEAVFRPLSNVGNRSRVTLPKLPPPQPV